MSVLVVDKARGPTSLDVVKRIERALGLPRRGAEGGKRLRFGHGGTLDPMATGVLPVCVGEGTKLAQFLLEADKEYETTVRLGTETDTLDADGQVTAQVAVGDVDETRIQEVLVGFRGLIEQVPPMYSALKREGKPLYEYARSGVDLPREPRKVTIHELELISFTPPNEIRLRVKCSKGTYVRTLGADIGTKLGVGAHLTSLRRIASGPFTAAQALPVEEIEGRLERGESLPWISPADALVQFASVVVPAELVRDVEQGKRLLALEIGWKETPTPSGAPRRLLRPDGSLLAVANRETGGRLLTLRVFLPEAGPK